MSNISDTIEILALGIDFADDYTQLAYLDKTCPPEPESFSVIKGEKKYLIPTVLYRSPVDGGWYIGDDAIYRAKDENKDGEDRGMLLKNIPKMIEEQNIADYNGEDTTSEELSEIYFGLILKIFENRFEACKIHNIAVSVERPDRKLIDAIYGALTKAGYDKSSIRVIDRSEAFIYYMLRRDKDLRVNETALFDFTEKHFIYRKLKTINKISPAVIRVEDTNLTDMLNFEMLSDDDGIVRADMRFLQIIRESFKKSIVSAVYLTGSGFYEKWAVESLNELCSKRRVFMGQNLFVRGAAFSAIERYNDKNGLPGISDREYFFDCMGRTKVNVSIAAVHAGKELLLPLSYAGTNWYEAGAGIECIPDGIDKIRLIFTEPVSMTAKDIYIDISGMPKRPDKMTRLKISLAYMDDVNCIVRIKDLGFGDFFRTSETVIRENIDIEKLF